MESVCVCVRGWGGGRGGEGSNNMVIKQLYRHITDTYQVVAETLCTSAETAMAAKRQKTTSELKYINNMLSLLL